MKQVQRVIAMLALLLVSGILFAQSPQNWAGQVVDPEGNPIPGVAVFVVGNTSNAAITNEQGTFSISARPQDDLQISCLGYETLTMKANSPGLKRIVLRDESQVLQSSVVTALGIKRQALKQGINIVISADGKTKIVYIK